MPLGWFHALRGAHAGAVARQQKGAGAQES